MYGQEVLRPLVLDLSKLYHPEDVRSRRCGENPVFIFKFFQGETPLNGLIRSIRLTTEVVYEDRIQKGDMGV